RECWGSAGLTLALITNTESGASAGPMATAVSEDDLLRQVRAPVARLIPSCAAKGYRAGRDRLASTRTSCGTESKFLSSNSNETMKGAPGASEDGKGTADAVDSSSESPCCQITQGGPCSS